MNTLHTHTVELQKPGCASHDENPDSTGSILFMDVTCTINYQTAVRSKISCKFELDDAVYFGGLKPKAQIVRACPSP